MQAELIGPADQRWTDTLATVRHDFYHRPAFVALSAAQEAGRPAAFLARDKDAVFFLPLILRSIDPRLAGQNGLCDAVSPYGYPGPLCTGSATFQREAVSALRATLQAVGVVSAFIRLHPLLSPMIEPMRPHGTIVEHGRTVYVDLTCSPEERWRQLRHNHRRDINKARRQGQVVRVDSNWQQFETFVTLYYETMRRVGANDYYFFPRADLASLRDALGSRLHLVTVEHRGAVVSAGLFTECNGIVEYHLSGTRTDALPLRPLKTMLHFVQNWAAERGNQLLHLGGGVGGTEDNLFYFKAGFSNRRARYATWRIVTARQSFDRLVAGWEYRHERTASGMSGHFPPYRQEPQP